MSAPSFSPRFVKAKVAFKIDKTYHAAGEHLVNSSGVPGFKWTHFDPLKAMGQKTHCTLQFMTSMPFEINCDALFTCEQTEQATSLGLDFILTPEQKIQIDQAVAEEGVLPEYVRKFPRIHYQSRVNVFPSRSIMRFFFEGDDVSMVCDIDNLSPSGIQIYTEDPRAKNLSAGEVVRVQIQPRGAYNLAISLNAAVKRIIHAHDPSTNNVKKYLGLSIMTISNEHKQAFTEMLKLIVVAMKA